jgi:16S rRNA (cytosine967-C5)-methyltransferase
MKKNEQKGHNQESRKLYFPVVEGVLKALKEIFNENKKADKVISGVLKSNPKWGLIKYCAGLGDLKVNEERHFLDILAAWFVLRNEDISNLHFAKNTDVNGIWNRYEDAQKDRKLKYSFTNWMDEKLSKETRINWDEEVEAMHVQADVYLRVNTLRVSADELIDLLKKQGVYTKKVPGVPSALVLEKRHNVFSLEEFKKGLFEVQDAGSQMIVDFLEVSPGQRVVDACAGAGGKALQIASYMQNKGKVIAMDIEEYKLVELKKRSKRNGADTIETRLIDAKVIKRLHDSADRLLLDVPCSGLGVLKRNPDAKWKLQPEFIEEIKVVQQEILQNYSKMLKHGGQMVYATCSVLSEENEDQVQKFISNNPDFEFVREQRLTPAVEGFDGFYMALIKRK